MVLFSPLGDRVLAKPMKYASLARLTLSLVSCNWSSSCKSCLPGYFNRSLLHIFQDLKQLYIRFSKEKNERNVSPESMTVQNGPKHVFLWNVSDQFSFTTHGVSIGQPIKTFCLCYCK